jgi:hypothetical protein
MTKTATKPLKAYAVLETCEDTGGIIFARRDIEARKRGSCEYSDGDITGVSCRRAPWADQYVETQSVPVAAAIEHGWRFECHGCAETLTYDWFDDNALPLSGAIGTMDSLVFCCSECKGRFDEVERRKKAFGEEFLDVLRLVVTERFGAVEFCSYGFRPHVYVIEQSGALGIGQAAISFQFPGQIIAPATLKFEWPYSFSRDGHGPVNPYYTCTNGDREAFEAFAVATKRNAE